MHLCRSRVSNERENAQGSQELPHAPRRPQLHQRLPGRYLPSQRVVAQTGLRLSAQGYVDHHGPAGTSYARSLSSATSVVVGCVLLRRLRENVAMMLFFRHSVSAASGFFCRGDVSLSTTCTNQVWTLTQRCKRQASVQRSSSGKGKGSVVTRYSSGKTYIMMNSGNSCLHTVRSWRTFPISASFWQDRMVEIHGRNACMDLAMNVAMMELLLHTHSSCHHLESSAEGDNECRRSSW